MITFWIGFLLGFLTCLAFILVAIFLAPNPGSVVPVDAMEGRDNG